MAFSDLENSIEDGIPIALYQFSLGEVIWRYTSADQDIVANGFTWKKAAISDDGQRQTGETTNDALVIDAPAWIGPSQVYMSSAPSSDISVIKFSKHQNHTEVNAEYVGDISQVNFPFPGRCKITCETLSATMRREGLRLGWQRSCPYAVYDLNCGVDKADFAATAFVLAIDGYTLTVELTEEFDSFYFNRGFIEWSHPIRGIERVAIENHVVTDTDVVKFVLLTDPGELYAGVSLTAYPGCSFTPLDCFSKFDNYLNYGGAPDIPGKSPFDGTPVF